jgi:hypothetical protein
MPLFSGECLFVEIDFCLATPKPFKNIALIPVLGSSSVASAVFNGKRAISKTQARKLAEFFHVSADLVYLSLLPLRPAFGLLHGNLVYMS